MKRKGEGGSINLDVDRSIGLNVQLKSDGIQETVEKDRNDDSSIKTDREKDVAKENPSLSHGVFRASPD